MNEDSENEKNPERKPYNPKQAHAYHLDESKDDAH